MSHHKHVRAAALYALLVVSSGSLAAAQSAGTPSAASPAPATRPPFLRRGDEVEARYNLYRARLEQFFNAFSARLAIEAPELRQKLLPPAPVPFGYQILPNLLADPPIQTQHSRIRLSPFSWPRTDSIIARGGDSLSVLETRLDSAMRLPSGDRKPAYAPIVDRYRKLVDGQKFMENLIQYNRLWQSEIARLPDSYRKSNELRDAALTRQALLDSMSRGDEKLKASRQARIDSLTSMLGIALKKGRTPEFVRVNHPTEHSWIVTVPMYTDIADSAFIARAKEAIENGWHVIDGPDDFSVQLDIRAIASSQLYANGTIPPHGEHIDVTAHLRRFPQDGVVLTTGANTTYASGQGIILGPHAIQRKTLVHEFGHMFGFRDGYFRSFADLGQNGFNVVEIILDPADIIATPENGKATRQHFEQIIQSQSAR